MKIRIISALSAVSILLLAACSPAAPSPAAPLPSNPAAPASTSPVIAPATETAVAPPTVTVQPPAGPDGATLLQERCASCHTLTRVTNAHKTADEWRKTVLRMVAKGARLDEQEQQILIEYLAKTYP